MIIERSEVEFIKALRKWTLIFGRRKTGKTFLIKNWFDFDEYYFIKKDRSVLTKNASLTYSEFMLLFSRALEDKKTVVVDEFHRLGSDFFEFLHFTDKLGKVILASSTLHKTKVLVGSNSPLLGLFAEVQIGLISLKDVLISLKKENLTNKELVETAILLREPLVIDSYLANSGKLYELVLLTTRQIVPGLVGEIFNEEDRTLSAIYEGILRATASGKSVSSEISSFLFARKLIQKDDPSVIQAHLINLVEIGILKKIQVLSKSKFIYKHASHLTQIFYYADEKYNLSEIQASREVVRKVANHQLPIIVEDNIREFLASYFGLFESVMQGPDFDVDGCLLNFKKVEIALEVKWKENIDFEDVRKAEYNLSKVEAKRKILFLIDKKKFKHETNLEVMDIRDFLN